jgi:hypothetical protein
MTGFIGFVANVLNRPTDGGTVSVRKSASEKELFSSACEYVKLPFSLKKIVFFIVLTILSRVTLIQLTLN